MSLNPQKSLSFYGTIEELKAELHGDWKFDGNRYKLSRNGTTHITWYPTTGTLLFQGRSKIASGLSKAVNKGILQKEKYKNRTPADLECNKSKTNTLEWLIDKQRYDNVNHDALAF